MTVEKITIEFEVPETTWAITEWQVTCGSSTAVVKRTLPPLQRMDQTGSIHPEFRVLLTTQLGGGYPVGGTDDMDEAFKIAQNAVIAEARQRTAMAAFGKAIS